MKTIHLHLALVSLAAAMLVAGCGGGGSSSGTTPPPAVGKVTLTSTNAPDVAKGGMTPSQTTAKTGLGGAAVVGVEVQPGASRQSVMNIALAQLRRVEGLKLPAAPAGVVGVIAGFSPVIIPCTTGDFTFDITDTDQSTTITNGDVFVISFNNCVEPDPIVAGATTTTNGTMSLAITSQGVTDTVTMSFTNFSVADTAPNPDETISMSGGITMAVSDNGTTLTATMSGSSFAVTSSIDGSFTMKNFSIAVSGDSPSATAPTGNYSFSVTMTTNIALLSGDIDITTPTPFTGTGDNNPTAGVMVITGANGGTLTLTAQSNGTAVTVVLDTDGASGSTAPQTLASTSWDAI